MASNSGFLQWEAVILLVVAIPALCVASQRCFCQKLLVLVI